MVQSLRVLRLLHWLLLATGAAAAFADRPDDGRKRYLYVASPGVRDYLQWGGHGVLAFDMDEGHRFVKRIALAGHGVDDQGKPLNVKGVCACAATGRLYVSTLKQLVCIDLVTDQVLWERSFDLGCDRMSLSPDGKTMYLPSLEKEVWYVVDAMSGQEIKRLTLNSRSHNTVYGLDGKHVYLAGLASPLLSVATTVDHSIERTVGPFSASVRPFTVNSAQTLVFANVNDLLGFEIGDLTTNKMMHRVEVQGYPRGPAKRHGCPSHGVALTPDETEVWISDAFNHMVHVFDLDVMPPRQAAAIAVREEPGWITFSLDGTMAYPSTGEVIDAKTRKIVAALTDEEGRPVHSEKMLEIDFLAGTPLQNGDQFGLGRRAKTDSRPR